MATCRSLLFSVIVHRFDVIRDVFTRATVGIFQQSEEIEHANEHGYKKKRAVNDEGWLGVGDKILDFLYTL